MSDDAAAKLETLRKAARAELSCLWDDLHRAQGEAREGRWSMLCDQLVSRIKDLTPLVGPTPWEGIQIPLLENGVYQRIHAELSIEAPVDMERVAGTRASIDARRIRARG